jgi:hypothetical protein
MMRISSFLKIESKSDQDVITDVQVDNKIRSEVNRRKRSEIVNQHQKQSKTITLNFHVQEYDIVLVEKMDDIDCLTLILNVSLSYSLI